MAKAFTLIHPEIDIGQGRTRELIEELLAAYREGRCEGGGEIAAVVSLLASEELLPTIAFLPQPGGPVQRLAEDFIGYIGASRTSSHPLVQRTAQQYGGVEQIPLFAAGFSNATGAIAATLMACAAGGGEVITTSLNYVGVPNAIQLAGFKPRFIDIDARTFNADPLEIERALSRKTRAIIITHLNGLVDLEPIAELYARKGLEIPLIQDASLAVGSACQGMRPGLINLGTGGVTVFSLATSKILSGLGGALLMANDRAIVEQALSVAFQGMDLSDFSRIDRAGANFKMNEINACIAREQLRRREAIFEHRRRLKQQYDVLLAEVKEQGDVALQELTGEDVVTHYAVLVPQREELGRRLYTRHGVMIGMWHTHHLQSLYRESRVRLPVTESVASRIAFLPFHTRLQEEDVRVICGALLEELHSLKRG